MVKEDKKLQSVRDPVCGMWINSNEAAGSLIHNDKLFYFCSRFCKTAFENSPDKFLTNSKTVQDNQRILKRVISYISTTRIHWLVESLQNAGINEIMVTEYFRPNSQISKFEFLCDEQTVDQIREIVHRIGTSGNSGDHFILIEDTEAGTKSIFPFV